MKLLTDAADYAVTFVSYNKAQHARIALLDRKTKIICNRFISTPNMEPVERELLAEELLRLQHARNRVVALILKLNLNS